MYTLPDIIKARALATPNKTAYIYLRDGDNDEDIITYRQLDEAAREIAGRLSKLNSKGVRALMLFPPGTAFIKSLYGCFYAGVIAVPAYAPRKNRSLDRIKSLVADSGAEIVLSISEIYNTCERSFHDLEELRDLAWVLVDVQDNSTSASQELPSILPTDIALLQYTSGSTGLPKGVMVTHQNIMRNLDFIRQSFSLTPKSVSVSWLPSFHDMGLIDGLIGPVYNGYVGVLMPPVTFIQKPVRWLRAISKYGGTHGGAPNFAFDLCVDGVSNEERSGIDLSSMDTMYCGAEPIRKNTFERFIQTYSNNGITAGSLYPCYGMAETTLIISGPEAGRGPIYLGVSGSKLELNRVAKIQPDDPDARFLVGVGKPWIDTLVKIVNPDTLEISKTDEVGEIWVSGSIVTAGYWNNKVITEQTYAARLSGDENVYLRTGDLGFFHEDELFITGRLKDMIILQGKNYYPQDIEFIAENCHPAIRKGASAAFSIEIDHIEKLVIVAEVERSYIRNLDTEAICDAIREHVTDECEQQVYAVQLLRTASILKTSSGKIQRKACRQAFLDKTLEVVGESVIESTQQSSVSNGPTVDLTSLQAWLLAWIHLKLGVSLEKIDAGKNISTYGLDSLKAVQLQQDFLQKYGVNIPPYVFFDKITVRKLSEMAYHMLDKAAEND